MTATELKAAFAAFWEENGDIKAFPQFKELKELFKGFYAVSYEVIGSRCSGMYLVRAANKTGAKIFVRAIYDDYVCRYPADDLLTYCQDMSENPFETVQEAYIKQHHVDNADVLPEDVPLGFTHCLESGT